MDQLNKTQFALLLFTNLFKNNQKSKDILEALSIEQPQESVLSDSSEESALDEAVGFGPFWSEYDMWI